MASWALATLGFRPPQRFAERLVREADKRLLHFDARVRAPSILGALKGFCPEV
jgi:hypothetical protein